MKRWFSILAATLLLFCNFSVQALAEEDFEEPQPVLEQEPNNSFEEAQAILNDDQVMGSLTKYDYDYFKIEINEKSYFSLYGSVEGPEDRINVSLYDADFNEVIDDEVYQGSVVYYDKILSEPGTYYIKVTDFKNSNDITENYKLIISVTPPDIKRIGGADRYETAVAIASEEADYAPQIFLATGEDFPDALAAAPLAFRSESPILLTRSKALPDSVKGFIKSHGVQSVTIIGGTGAVSLDVENYLRNSLRLKVTRIGGKDRFETAVKIAEQMPSFFKEGVIIVNGRNYPDAVSIAPITAYRPFPILLTDAKTMPAVTANFAKQYIYSYVIGGTGVVADSLLPLLPDPKRIGGLNRYETSVAIAEFFKAPGPQGAVVTTGENFPDALAAASIAGMRNDPIILTTPNSLHPSAQTYFESNQVLWYTIIGGTGAVSNAIEQDLWSIAR